MSKEPIHNVGDNVFIEYFKNEKNSGIVTKRIHLYGSRSKFFYEVYVLSVEEYIYLVSKDITTTTPYAE